MNESEFTHLHVHTDASPKDGLGSVERLVGAAKKKGFDALAMTDHGTLANSISFTIACQKAGIKPILGVEGYVELDGHTGHITLLADGDNGFSNLVKLQNIAHAREGKSQFSIDDLIEHANGLVCLTGCVASPLQSLGLRDAVTLGAKLKEVFYPRMFTEIMFTQDDAGGVDRALQLSEKLNLKLAVTNDIHFAERDDAPIHPILTSIKAGYSYESRELWCKGYEDLYPVVARYLGKDRAKDAMARSAKIGALLEPVNLKRPERLPEIERADEVLAKLCYEGMEQKGTLGIVEYDKRLNYELETIKTMGYSSYFIILRDIVNSARSMGTRVGSGRGSGAGSLVLFLLGITELDPLVYDLNFERFLNPFRKGMPDVDVDFDSDHRDQVIDYAIKRWNARPIATYSSYSHKTLVHDLAKQLRLPRDTERNAADKGPDSSEFKELTRLHPDFQRAYDTMLGQIKNRGKHAGGVIITDVEVPLERVGDRIVAAWTEGEEKELSYAGVVKFDLLGITALSTLRRLESAHGRRADPPVDGHAAFEIFRKGDLSGIFQFSGSPGIVSLTRDVAPTRFEDLIAINALYRPGALDAGTAQHYVEWRKEPRKIHPLVDSILEPTAGVVIYQEQVMAIFAAVTGGSVAEGDMARRVIVKSKVGDPAWELDMYNLRNQFIDAAVSRDVPTKIAEQLWHEIATHARYSFNKAHAACYAYTAWEMAWWKWAHPVDFYCASLNCSPDDAQAFIFSAAESKVHVQLPHVNFSGFEYENRDGKIYVPISQVKFIGEPAARAIIEERSVRGPYTSYENFRTRLPKRIVNSRACKGLYAIGAFTGFAGDPGVLGFSGELESAEPYVLQNEYLGLVIPTPEMVELFRRIRSKTDEKTRWLAGIISEKKDKASKWGPYSVYYLSPEGNFWSRDERSLPVGMMVKVKALPSSGKALVIQELDVA